MFKDQFWFRALIKGLGVRMFRVLGMWCGLPKSMYLQGIYLSPQMSIQGPMETQVHTKP